jgi:hypothetical protein
MLQNLAIVQQLSQILLAHPKEIENASKTVNWRSLDEHQFS